MPALQVAALLLTSGKCLYTAESGKTLHGNDLLELLACEERLASCSHLFSWPTLTGRRGASPGAEPAAPAASPAGQDAVWEATSLCVLLTLCLGAPEHSDGNNGSSVGWEQLWPQVCSEVTWDLPGVVLVCGSATRVLPGDSAGELPPCRAGAGGGHPAEPSPAQHHQGWPLPAADLPHRDRARLPLVSCFKS